MSDNHYEALEILANHTREEMFQMIQADIEMRFNSNYKFHELINEILELNFNGCRSLNEYSDKELAYRCLDIDMDAIAEWREENWI